VSRLKVASCFLAMTAIELPAAHKPPLQRAPIEAMSRANPFEARPPQEQSAADQAGHKLFERECSGCHGKQAQGSAWAPALASPVVKQAPAGAIFWVLRNGSLRSGMPSFAHLPEPQRWQIVTYLKNLK